MPARHRDHHRNVRASAGNLTRVLLELGGKSPDIKFADADIDAAVPGAAMAVFVNSRQICSAGTPLFAEQKVYDEGGLDQGRLNGQLSIMPGLVPGIHVLGTTSKKERGGPGQARPWRA